MKKVLLACACVLGMAAPSFAEDMVVYCTNISGEASPTGTFKLECLAKVSSLTFAAGFTVQLNYADNASQKVSAIQNAAVDVLIPLGVTVGGSDKKTLFGAPNN